jgi:hypothetical protein
LSGRERVREPSYRFFSGDVTTVVNVEFPKGLTTSATIEKIRLDRISSNLLKLWTLAVNRAPAHVATGSTFQVRTHGNLLSGIHVGPNSELSHARAALRS